MLMMGPTPRLSMLAVSVPPVRRLYLFRRPHAAYKHRGCCTASSPQHHGVSVLRSSLGMDHPGPLARALAGSSRAAECQRQRHEHRRDIADVRGRGFRGVLRRSVFQAHTHSWLRGAGIGSLTRPVFVSMQGSRSRSRLLGTCASRPQWSSTVSVCRHSTPQRSARPASSLTFVILRICEWVDADCRSLR